MNPEKIKKLQQAGMTITDASAWLNLTPEEETIVSMRIAMAKEVERLRKEKGISQKELAKELGTKQSGISRMESNPSASSLDMLVKALLRLGSTPRRIAALF